MADSLADRRPRVIIGGGFADLKTAKGLKKAPVDVLRVDENNHHLFQPWLYRVATAELEPAAIVFSIRTSLRKQQNVTVALVEIQSIDLERNLLRLPRGKNMYDLLVIACRIRQTYFGNDHYQPFAPGLKPLNDDTDYIDDGTKADTA